MLRTGVLIGFLLAASLSYGSEDYDRDICDDSSCNELQIDVDAAGGDADANADATVGDITIDAHTEVPADTTHRAKIEIENTPDIVSITPGSGDECVAHIGANLSLPGLGTGINIPLPGRECRKLSYYDRMIDLGELNAAEIIFCSLKEVSKEFDKLNLDCLETLTIYVPVTDNIVLTADEYEQLTAEAVQQEEYDEQQEVIERRYVQQQSLIESLQEQVAESIDDSAEIERVKREASELRVAEQEREVREAARRSAARKALNKDEVNGPEGDSQ